MIDAAMIKYLIAYDADRGLLTWRERPETMFKTARTWRAWNTLYANKPAFTARHGAGYRHGSILGESLLAHRVAWAIMHDVWPEVIDHINGNRADNRISNLRSVTAKDNSRNARLHARNKSGVNGVHQRKKDGRWLVNILVDGKTKYIGLFDTRDEAAVARKAAESHLGYHPSHGSPLQVSEGDQGGGTANNRPAEVAA